MNVDGCKRWRKGTRKREIEAMCCLQKDGLSISVALPQRGREGRVKVGGGAEDVVERTKASVKGGGVVGRRKRGNSLYEWKVLEFLCESCLIWIRYVSYAQYQLRTKASNILWDGSCKYSTITVLFSYGFLILMHWCFSAIGWKLLPKLFREIFFRLLSAKRISPVI